MPGHPALVSFPAPRCGSEAGLTVPVTPSDRIQIGLPATLPCPLCLGDPGIPGPLPSTRTSQVSSLTLQRLKIKDFQSWQINDIFATTLPFPVRGRHHESIMMCFHAEPRNVPSSHYQSTECRRNLFAIPDLIRPLVVQLRSLSSGDGVGLVPGYSETF